MVSCLFLFKFRAFKDYTFIFLSRTTQIKLAVPPFLFNTIRCLLRMISVNVLCEYNSVMIYLSTGRFIYLPVSVVITGVSGYTIKINLQRRQE